MAKTRPARRLQRPEDKAKIDALINANKCLRYQKRQIKKKKYKFCEKRIQAEKARWPAKEYIASVEFVQQNFNYYYALMGFPITLKWLKSKKISNTLGIALIVCSYREIIFLWEINAWFPRGFRTSLNRLEVSGHIQKIKVQNSVSKIKVAYILTPQGKLLIDDYKRFFDEYMEKNKKVHIFNSREHLVGAKGKKKVYEYKLPPELVAYEKTRRNNGSTQPDSTAKGV